MPDYEREPPEHPIPEEPFDASDPDQVQRAKRDEGRRLKEMQDAIRGLLGKPAGRLWMWRLMQHCNLTRSSHSPGDPYQTAYNEGARAVSLILNSDLSQADPKMYALMIKEAGNG